MSKDPSPQSDVALVAAAGRGDTRSFGLLVARYQGLVCALAYSATGRIGISEDVAQEAFVTAWRSLRSLKDPGSFRAWLCGITRNLGSEARRRLQADPLGAPAGAELAEQAAAPATSALDRMVTAEDERQLWAALEQIPDTYREPLVLYYREGRSLDAVADALELTRDALHQRLSRARQMLRAELAPLVESTLSRSGPSKAFTAAVLASIGVAAGATSAAGATAAIAIGTAGKTMGLVAGAALVATSVTVLVVTTHVSRRPDVSARPLVAALARTQETKVPAAAADQPPVSATPAPAPTTADRRRPPPRFVPPDPTEPPPVEATTPPPVAVARSAEPAPPPTPQPATRAAPTPSTPSEAVRGGAEATFLAAEKRFKEFEAEALVFAGKPEAMKRLFEQFVAESKSIREDYNKVLAYKEPQWTLAALTRMGDVYNEFARKLEVAGNEPPPDLVKLASMACKANPNDCGVVQAQFRDAINQFTVPVSDQARQLWKSAIDQSGRLGITNAHVDRAKAGVIRLHLQLELEEGKRQAGQTLAKAEKRFNELRAKAIHADAAPAEVQHAYNDLVSEAEAIRSDYKKVTSFGDPERTLRALARTGDIFWELVRKLDDARANLPVDSPAREQIAQLRPTASQEAQKGWQATIDESVRLGTTNAHVDRARQSLARAQKESEAPAP